MDERMDRVVERRPEFEDWYGFVVNRHPFWAAILVVRIPNYKQFYVVETPTFQYYYFEKYADAAQFSSCFSRVNQLYKYPVNSQPKATDETAGKGGESPP